MDKNLQNHRILLGAHRGDRRNYPENTMPAFRAAVEMGCDAIETDVRMTKDGHLVLIHDRDTLRTTGVHGFVDEMTLAELRALDAGGFKGEDFRGEKIPTVEDFLEFVAGTDVIVNWELKEYPSDFEGDRAYRTADRLIALIDAYGIADRSLMNSFSQKLLDYIDRSYPKKFAIHGYIGYEKIDVCERPLQDFLDWAVIWYKPTGFVAGRKEDYDVASSHGIPTCILVPDTEEAYREALTLGCTMFTSDDPRKAIDILRTIGVR